MQSGTGEPGTGGSHSSSRIIRFVDAFATVCKYLTGLFLVAIVVINGCNVFMRYVMSWAISWAEEGMVFLMLATVFIGAIPVTWDRAHIRIDAFVASLGGRARLVFEWIAVLVTAVVLWTVGWLSYGVVQKLRGFDQRSDALDLPVWIPQATVPFALLLIPLVMALALMRGTGGPHDKIEG
jgi:TRAP-type C4-dicarboxylate transport system permease small subunit